MSKEFKGFIGAMALICVILLSASGCAKLCPVDPVAPAPVPAPVTEVAPPVAPAPAAVTEVAPPPHAAWEPAQIWPGPAAEELLADVGDRHVADPGVGDPGVAAIVLEGRTSAPLLPVYFDFDRSNVRPDQVARVTRNGNFMLDNPRVRVRVEGNADERGTREYNMALGERRALSARKFLMDMGVAAGRLETISFGEDKPLCFTSDEACWALNRRADFVILR